MPNNQRKLTIEALKTQVNIILKEFKENWVELNSELEEKITKSIIKELWQHGIRQEFSDEETVSLVFQKLKESVE